MMANDFFIAPMLRSFSEPPGADASGFFADLGRELSRFPSSILETAVDEFRRTRKYRTFPTIAECLEVCRRVAPKDAAAQPDRPFVPGRVWVKAGTEEWRAWDEHWLRMRGVHAPRMRSVTGEDGWYFTALYPKGQMADGVPI